MRVVKDITREIAVASSPRLQQVLGMFDVPPQSISSMHWHIDLTLPDHWNVGVIVGPSGSGKSTVACECFNDCCASDFTWPRDRSILDGFPLELSVRRVVALLSSVGFSSPPAWVRPFHVLSAGQQFRVSLARALAEAMVDGVPRLVDEYSSVVDRTVARIGSAAVAKTVRRYGLKFIAVTCHYDVLDWLEPDWVYEPHVAQMWRADTATYPPAKPGDTLDGQIAPPPNTPGREVLRRYTRPPIELEILRTDRTAWPRFKPHHYLSADLHQSAACFVGLVDGQPAAFTAVLPFPHPTRPGWREHRTVCLPDFQGVGIGNAMSEFIASIYKATGKPYTSTTSHPAMIHHRARSPLWRMTRKPSLVGGHAGGFATMRKTSAIDRLTAGFEYIGPARAEDARNFGLGIPRARSALIPSSGTPGEG
jgi:ABC-type ATPase involved in cell division